MDARTRAIVLWIWVVVATFGGIGLVLFTEPPLPIIGVLAIILGLISLMPALYYTLEPSEEAAA